MELKDTEKTENIGAASAGSEKKESVSKKILNSGPISFIRKKKKLLIFLVILIIGGMTALQVKAAVDAAQLADTGITQTFDEVTSKDISNSIAVTGTIASNESRTLSTLVSNTEVEEVFVEVGDYVNVGDPICNFDTSSIESNIEKTRRQIQVNNARANLELAKANTQVAWAWEDYYDNQADGQYDLSAAMNSYQQTQNSVADAIATLEDRERALDEAKDLYHDYKKAKNNGTVSTNSKFSSGKSSSDYKEDIRDAEDAVSSASRSLQNANLNLENSINSYNQAVEKLKDQGRTDLRTISNNMVSVVEAKLNNMTTNDEAEEKIREYEESLDKCNITAPISGIVTSVSVVEGEEYSEKSTICVIQDDSSYKVSATVDQYDIAKITESMNCVIKSDATGDDQMEGVLTFVSPVPQSSSTESSSGSSGGSSSSSTAYPVEITINGRDDRLRIGMTAEASILLESREGVKAVPYDAIEEDSDGKFYVNVEATAGGHSGAPAGDFEVPSAGVEKASTEASTEENGSEEESTGKGGRKHELSEDDGTITPPDSGNALKTGYSGNPLANFIAEKIIGMPASELYAETAETPTRRVEVEKGLETDYYTEIISDEIEIGDRVLINAESSSDSGSSDWAMMGGPGGGPGPGGHRGGF